MITTQRSDAEIFDNNCARYEHVPGFPYPMTHGSCKGCIHSIDPMLYDAGCGHDDGFLRRDRDNDIHLTREGQRRLDQLRRRIAEGSLKNPKLTYDDEIREIMELLDNSEENRRD